MVTKGQDLKSRRFTELYKMVNKLKVERPELEFDETPRLSKESEIIGVEKDEYRSGIILDSIKEFENALRIYDGGCVVSSKSTEDNLVDSIEREHGILGVGILSMGLKTRGRGLIDNLVKNSVDSLKRTGRFNQHFDYDGMGTRFFKTSVDARIVDGKYILGLNAAYVGNEPERELAKFLDKPRQLLRADVNAVMSIVDDWWFNINLEETVKKIPFMRKELKYAKEWGLYLENQYKGKAPKASFKHNGDDFNLAVGLNAHSYLRPANTDIDEYYLSPIGKNIVGAAWKIYDGNTEIFPTPENPSVSFSVSFPKEGYYPNAAVTDDQMSSLYSARDYIAELISGK